MLSDLKLREAVPADGESVANIYNYYVRESTATFEEQPVNTAEMAQRIVAVQQTNLPWLIAEDQEGIIAYAYAKVWNSRSAYRFTVETSVYVKHDVARGGAGTMLYQELFSRLRSLSIQQTIAIITLPNDASVAFHRKFGMQQVAHLKQVGYKFGQWLDVGYWQGSLVQGSVGQRN